MTNAVLDIQIDRRELDRIKKILKAARYNPALASGLSEELEEGMIMFGAEVANTMKHKISDKTFVDTGALLNSVHVGNNKTIKPDQRNVAANAAADFFINPGEPKVHKQGLFNLALYVTASMSYASRIEEYEGAPPKSGGFAKESLVQNKDLAPKILAARVNNYWHRVAGRIK